MCWGFFDVKYENFSQEVESDWRGVKMMNGGSICTIEYILIDERGKKTYLKEGDMARVEERPLIQLTLFRGLRVLCWTTSRGGIYLQDKHIVPQCDWRRSDVVGSLLDVLGPFMKEEFQLEMVALPIPAINAIF